MADTPAITQLLNLLGKELRIEVTDGRVITGRLGCIDKEKNIILRECMEEQVFTLPGEGGRVIKENRVLGIVLVPGRYMVSCGVKKD